MVSGSNQRNSFSLVKIICGTCCYGLYTIHSKVPYVCLFSGDESILLQKWIESKLGNKYTRALIFWISSWSMDLWCKHLG